MQRQQLGDPPLIGKRQIYPVLLPFPIWRYGSIYGRLDGRYIRDGWWPDPYAAREVEEAEHG
jgi:hypothetical protein